MIGALERKERIGRVVVAVIRQAVADARAEALLLPPANRCESRLAREWCEAAVGEGRVVTDGGGSVLTVHAATRTTLLLTPVFGAALLPLGDLYGSEVLELGGDWKPPEPVRELADAAGGADALDQALSRWADERRSPDDAFRGLPPTLAGELRAVLAANRFARRHGGLVPKLTGRTVGIDLWE
jgi:hypothetical protein